MASNDRRGRRTTLKVIVLGDSGVGKSTIVDVYRHGRTDWNLTPTIRMDVFHKDVVVAGEPCILEIRDVAGQERYRSVCSSYYRSCDACILVFSIDNHTSYQSVYRWQQDILGCVSNKEHAKFPFVVVGNKCDLPESTPRIPVEDIRRLCEAQGDSYFQTSCCSVHTISPVMETALVRARLYNRVPNACDGIATKLENTVLLASDEDEQDSHKCACL